MRKNRFFNGRNVILENNLEQKKNERDSVLHYSSSRSTVNQDQISNKVKPLLVINKLQHIQKGINVYLKTILNYLSQCNLF